MTPADADPQGAIGSLNATFNNTTPLLDTRIDLAKHVTTLSSGSIVVIVTFADKLKSASHVKSLQIAVVVFLVSIAAAMISSYLAHRSIYRMRIALDAMHKLQAGDPNRVQQAMQKMTLNATLGHRAETFSNILFLIAMVLFVSGLVALGVFAFLNLK
jgi:hypothetical protein